ncbi:MAG: CPBP family intramembrane glutamic endopeptidase [Rhodomicrobium sp.]
MYSSAHSGSTVRDIFGRPSIMAIPYSLLNPFFEELIVRAYLMTEVRALTGSWMLATALSVVVQFSYHLYYGWEGAIALSFLFLVFSIYYARTQRATPIIVAHGIFDIWGLVRMF